MRTNPFPSHCRAAALFCLAGLARVFAATTHTVTTMADLKMRVGTGAGGAQPGDTILVKNGAYELTSELGITCEGTAEAPITIAAESIGGVEITGSSGYSFTVKNAAAHLVISGFKFRQQADKTVVFTPAHHIRFTRNIFACANSGTNSMPFLRFTADDVEVDHNEFRDKATLGNMISIYGPGAPYDTTQVARRAWIHHNHFHDFTPLIIGGARQNGAETIRIGVSGVSMSRGDALVEHNLFERCTGDVEIISNKSCGNTYRHNTFIDCPTSSFTLRHGNDCTVYGNVFRNTAGLRFYGDRHLIHSNYLEGNTVGINIGNGDIEIGDGQGASASDLTGHDRPDNCIVAFNTLVGNTVAFRMDKVTGGGLGATGVIIANNLVQGSGTLFGLGGTLVAPAFEGNIQWAVAAAGDFTGGNFAAIDPQLARSTDAQNIQRPAASSPVIAAAQVTGAYAGAIATDLLGRARPATGKTIGADEAASAAARTASPLTPADVGPFAQPPSVSGFSPATIIASQPGIIITGSRFSAVTGVYFGSLAAAAFTVDSGTQITATAPAALPASGNIVVTTINGAGTGAAAFFAAVPPNNPAPLVARQVVAAGRSVTFTASAAGTPAPAYQWQISTDGGTTWANINGATSPALTLNNIAAAMTGNQYRYIASNGHGAPLASAAADLEVVAASFSAPAALAFAPYEKAQALPSSATRTLYVADTDAHTIQQIKIEAQSESGGGVVIGGVQPLAFRYSYSCTLAPLAGATAQQGTTDATGTNARFKQPGALASDSSGNLYVADTGNGRIRKINTNTLAVTTLATGMTAPAGIALDATGTACIADKSTGLVHRMTPAGALSIYAGKRNQSDAVEGTGTNAVFANPTHVIVDSGGHLYIADTGNHLIRTVDGSGRILFYAGAATLGGSADGDIALGSVLLNHPQGMATDFNDNVYFADTDNSTIRRLGTDGQVTTIAGNPGVAGLCDGAGTLALFDHPRAVAYDGLANLYVADTGNALIRRIALATGKVTTCVLTTATTSGTTPPPLPPNGNGGSGGDGAPSLWFVGVLLAALAIRSGVRRRP